MLVIGSGCTEASARVTIMVFLHFIEQTALSFAHITPCIASMQNLIILSISVFFENCDKDSLTQVFLFFTQKSQKSHFRHCKKCSISSTNSLSTIGSDPNIGIAKQCLTNSFLGANATPFLVYFKDHNRLACSSSCMLYLVVAAPVLFQSPETRQHAYHCPHQPNQQHL
jgi:hypothetical protein